MKERARLRGLLRQIAAGPELGRAEPLSVGSAWEAPAVAEQWLGHFREEMQPLVEAEQRAPTPSATQASRPSQAPVVTGYLIGDDSTIEKRKGKKMEGLGVHHSTTAGEAGARP